MSKNTTGMVKTFLLVTAAVITGTVITQKMQEWKAKKQMEKKA